MSLRGQLCVRELHFPLRARSLSCFFHLSSFVLVSTLSDTFHTHLQATMVRHRNTTMNRAKKKKVTVVKVAETVAAPADPAPQPPEPRSPPPQATITQRTPKSPGLKQLQQLERKVCESAKELSAAAAVLRKQEREFAKAEFIFNAKSDALLKSTRTRDPRLEGKRERRMNKLCDDYNEKLLMLTGYRHMHAVRENMHMQLILASKDAAIARLKRLVRRAKLLGH